MHNTQHPSKSQSTQQWHSVFHTNLKINSFWSCVCVCMKNLFQVMYTKINQKKGRKMKMDIYSKMKLMLKRGYVKIPGRKQESSV